MRSILLLLAAIVIPSLLLGQNTPAIQDQPFDNRIDSLCRAIFSEWNLPGMAVVVIKDGKELHLGGYGKSSYDTHGKSITPDTRFVIASTTKAMTAALLATLIQKGDIKWSDTVVNHLPDFKLYDPWVTQNFTVQDIMTHKTGFKAYAGDDLPHFGYNRDQIYTLLRHLRPSYSFRTTYAYCNTIYTTAAKLIEKYYGCSWDDAIIKYLFAPLEMNSSTTGNISFREKDNLAQGHRQYKEGSTIKFEPRTDTASAFRWLSAVAPAGFVISTARDMGHWLTMLLSKGSYNNTTILSKESINSLFYPRTITGADSTTLYNYAQGWTLESGAQGKIIRHAGLAYGYTSLVAMAPEHNLGVAVLINAGNTNNPHMAIFREILQLYSQQPKKDWREYYLTQYMKESPKPREKEAKDSIAPKRLELYVGSYYKTDFGEVKITLEENELYFALNKVKAQLIHKNGDLFTMTIPGAGSIEVSFSTGINTPIESLTFNIGDPIGEFYRNFSN